MDVKSDSSHKSLACLWVYCILISEETVTMLTIHPDPRTCLIRRDKWGLQNPSSYATTTRSQILT